MSIEMISIPKEKYDELVNDSLFMRCLREAGVSYWEGWDYAMSEFDSIKGDDK